MDEKNHILKNLYSLIRNSSLTYMNEFVWQDIELTQEFKTLYIEYLEKNRSDIEFFDYTAIITSSSTKYVFIPNQWFVIASYAVDVCEELFRYKEYLRKVSDKLYKKFDVYVKQLRDDTLSSDKDEFMLGAKEVFGSFCSDPDMVEESSSRLWRFATDYAWWSGQKTIDRGDFFVSVVLNMLNLVNTSQGYVADIVYAYVNSKELRELVSNIEAFTVNMGDVMSEEDKTYVVPDEEIRNQNSDIKTNTEAIPKPERVRIKINGKNTMKEIKYKG